MTNTITLPRSVVEQALDALQDADTIMEHRQDVELRHSAMAALRAALEQPQVEQEPVRVFFPRHTPQHGEDWAIDPAFLRRVLHSIEPDTPCEFTPSPEQIESVLLALEVIPSSIYTHPQPKREPLTKEEIAVIAAACGGLASDFVVSIARAIERAHGIKGDA